jgi:prepilin-type N-terminal cleavage/methylation domain-containing protein
MKHRPGVTLLEVLTAIFIMGIGLLALLTLFPLGALSMAQALQNDRAQAAAVTISENAIAMNLRQDTNVTGSFTNPPPNRANGPSWGVLVDPIGLQFGNALVTLGKTGLPLPVTPGIQRVSPSYASTTGTAVRWFSMPDDVAFLKHGAPDMSTGFINRGGRYTAACLLVRPDNSRPSVVDLYTIVYAGRNTAVPSDDEIAYAAVGAQGSNNLSIYYTPGQTKPALRKGTWLLDSTFDANNGVVTGAFYRVVNSTDASPTQVDVELESPLKTPLNPNSGVVVVLGNVIEVFERRSAWQP